MAQPTLCAVNTALAKFSYARAASQGNGSEDSSAHAERVQRLLTACAHYPKSDRPLFLAGYGELCRIDLTGKKILEVCCGYGELTRQMARVFPGADVIGMDRYPEAGGAIVEAREKAGLKNVRYHWGDVLQLTQIADASLDLIFGQATLHHLAHDLATVRQEFSRVLKPGGRLIFIFEPLGHNPVWAMIRAYRIARAALCDESNIVLSQLNEIGLSFSQCEVQAFNLLGYPFKALGRFAGEPLMNVIDRLDTTLMQRSSRLAALAANFNVVFTK